MSTDPVGKAAAAAASSGAAPAEDGSAGSAQRRTRWFLPFRHSALGHTLLATAVAVGVGSMGPGPLAVPAAQAQSLPTASADSRGTPVPHNPQDQDEAAVWANPNGRSTDPHTALAVTLTRADPPVITAIADNSGTGSARVDRDPTYTLRLKNHGSAPATNLSVQLLHSTAASTEQLRLAQLSNVGEYPSTSRRVDIPGTLAPGQSRDVPLTLKLTSGSTTATSAPGQGEVNVPGITGPGTYPLAFAVSAQLSPQSQSSGTGDAQLAAVTRTTLSITGQAKRDQSSPLTFLWPLAAETHVAAGNTGDAPNRAPLYLTDEHLAQEISPGGRLRGLLDAYKTAVEGPNGSDLRASSCLAIDPDLLDTVDAMTAGYMVGSEVPSRVKDQKRLRDSWGEIFSGKDTDAVPGTGSGAARSWLADLRQLVEKGCSVSLPYAGAGFDSLAAAGQDWLAVHAYGRGPETIHRVLGVYPLQNVVIPGAEGMDAGHLDMLAAGASEGINASMNTRFEVMQRGAPAFPPDAQVTAVVADNTVRTLREAQVPQAGAEGADSAAPPGNPAAKQGWNDRLFTLTPPPDSQAPLPPGHRFRALTYSGALGAVLAATGEHPEVAGYTNPQSRYDLAADSPTARMGDALAALDSELAPGKPVLAVPPALWTVDADGASAFLQAVGTAFRQQRATPAGFGDALTPRGVAPEQLAQGTPTVPFVDPGEPYAAHAQRISQLERYVEQLTLFMRNDPNITLTREVFTRPLFIDLVRATSSYRSREKTAWSQSWDERGHRLDVVRDVTATLRHSVSLLPPSNVFTRTSAASPLLVVARNGLPLPVSATVGYRVRNGQPISLSVPAEQVVPARGSITLPVTTDAGSANHQTDLTLWLATPSGDQISESVEVRMRSAPGRILGLLAVGTVGLFAAAVTGRVWWQRSKRSERPRPKPPTGEAPGVPSDRQG
ncbi:hypothetical protein [Corynebacterium heidelbergense]|uniref:Secreted protein n=1 Tax=Corynebacterium heidelbergense TaxID=2055947 RepID=A0A364VA44_9CORY|nr:hypothetical protein [Corynebacterium heidelbergense]RAV33436.1 hypothetical protein CWC39_08495 [Corynebacterium heidelbergense]WCZ37604.1 hypothetical protein CHEID_10435 [Corynebacterium heidelbergense]